MIELREIITIYEGLAVHAQSKATRLLPQKNRFPVGQRAHHVNTVNVGTWEIPFLANIYLNEVLDQIYNSVTQKLPDHLGQLGFIH